MIVPIQKMNERLNVEKHDSDTSYLIQLMLACEQLLKLVTCAMVSGIDDDKADPKNSQFAFSLKLIIADSIGYWKTTALDPILTGSAHAYLRPEFIKLTEELTITRHDLNSWQYQSLFLINECVKELKSDHPNIPARYALHNWFSLFITIRNDARGHGILTADTKSKICFNLDKSLKLITENISILKVPWIYVKQNIVGTHRVTPLNDLPDFNEIKKMVNSLSLKDGVYLVLDKPLRIHILDSSIEALDFFLPNGNFRPTTYETMSYITGVKKYKESSDYLSDSRLARLDDKTISRLVEIGAMRLPSKVRKIELNEGTLISETQNKVDSEIFKKTENIIDQYDDWLVGALNFDQDLHFSSFYLDQSWKNKLPNEFKEFGYECLIACYQDFEETYFIPERECRRVANNLIKKMLSKPDWFDNILNQTVKLCDELLKVFPFRPDSNPFNGMQNHELVEFYTKHNTAHTSLYVYSRLPEALDRGRNYFTENLKNYLKKLHPDLTDTKNLNEVFEIFTFPEEISIAGSEFVEFMEILETIKNNDDLKELFSGSGSTTRKILLKTKPELLKQIENHREKWMFWNYHGYGNRVLRDVSYFLEKFKSSVNDISVEEKANRYQNIFKQADKRKDEYFTKYNVDVIYQKQFSLYSRIGAVKLYRRYIQLQNFYFLDQLISRISHNLNIEEEIIRNLLPEEIEKLIRHELTINNSHKERVKNSAVIYSKSQKNVIAGEEAKAIMHRLKTLSKETTLENDILTGEPCVTQENIIKGHCKVVLKKEDLDRLIFNFGDILVCEAADPDLYDIMKNASAVLTEQGGVTSHSATYCRENNIKSITGIKGLLDNIFTNDLVEVDTKLGKITKTAPQFGELIITAVNETAKKSDLGSKAYNLIQLKNAGIEIPDFFCISLESLRKVLHRGTPNSIGMVSQALWDEVNIALDRLDGDLFAIRSSFNNEDGDHHSGAGMNRTELHLTKEDIIKTIISIASEVIFSSDSNLSGSIIIQQMILGDLSGVVFSINPVSKNENEIILETVPGGNEILTDGLVRPIKFLIDKASRSIKDKSEDNLWKDLISDKMISEIVNTCIVIEKLYSKPQDIEWTVTNDTIYILQSRPITYYSADIPAPPFRKLSKSKNDIISIYRSYRIPENLQRHMLEVTAVAKWILDNRSDSNKLNEQNILTTLLLHDIGNIVKGLDESFANLFPEGYKFMPYWKAVQRWIMGRYGDTDTVATLNIAKEIGVSDRVMYLLENKQFLNNEFVYESDDMELKICAYSDQRVSPYGILPVRERLKEAVNRYKGAKKKISVNDPKRDKLIEFAVKIEGQIFSGMKKSPNDVVNNTTQYMKELRSFDIKANKTN